MIYQGNSKCRYCDTPVQANLIEGYMKPSIGKHEFIQTAIRFDNTVEITFKCYNCGKKDTVILRK